MVQLEIFVKSAGHFVLLKIKEVSETSVQSSIIVLLIYMSLVTHLYCH